MSNMKRRKKEQESFESSDTKVIWNELFSPMFTIVYIEVDADKGKRYFYCSTVKSADENKPGSFSWNDPIRIESSKFDSIRDIKAVLATLQCKTFLQGKQLLRHTRMYVDSCIASANQRQPIDRFGFDPDRRSFRTNKLSIYPGFKAECTTLAGPAADAYRNFGGIVGQPMHMMQAHDTYRDKSTDLGKYLYMAAFASPLMQWVEDKQMHLIVTGCSGTGKTALQRAITAVWGKSVDTHLNVKDTANARTKLASTLNNIPIVFDEVTTLNDEDIKELLYSNGYGRNRLNSHGGISKDSDQGWEGLMICSANKSVFNVFAAHDSRTETEAMAARCLEIPLNQSVIPNASLHKPLLSMLNNNYGGLGPLFMQNVLASGSSLKDIRSGVVRSVIENSFPNPPIYARKWLSFFAAMELTAQFLSQSPDFGHQWAGPEGDCSWVTKISKMLYKHNLDQYNLHMPSYKSLVVDIIHEATQYLMEYENGLPIDMGGAVKRGISAARGTIENTNGKIVCTVDVALFRKICKFRRTNFTDLVKGAEEEGVLTRTTFKGKLGVGEAYRIEV